MSITKSASVQEDYDFIRQLAAIYDGLSSSALSPVIIDNQFYYALDDETEAKQIMRARLQRTDVLKQHYQAHLAMRDCCVEIDRHLGDNNRNEMARSMLDLTHKLLAYSLLVVGNQQMTQGGFLAYPTAPGTSLYLREADPVGLTTFNPSKSYTCIVQATSTLQREALGFTMRDQAFPDLKVCFRGPEEDSLRSHSLTGKIALCQDLLHRVQ